MGTITFPPIEHPKVAPLIGEYDRLVAEYRALQTKRHQLASGRSAALDADAGAFAAAIRADKPDPGPAHVEKVDQEVAQVARRLDALERAVADQLADVTQAVERYGPEVRAKLDQRAAKARGALTKDVEKLRADHAELMSARGIASWLDGFPERTKWAAQAGGWVPLLRGANGEPLTIEHVLGALTALTEPPRPATAPVYPTMPRPESPKPAPQRERLAERIA